MAGGHGPVEAALAGRGAAELQAVRNFGLQECSNFSEHGGVDRHRAAAARRQARAHDPRAALIGRAGLRLGTAARKP